MVQVCDYWLLIRWSNGEPISDSWERSLQGV
jgi:hypothetical protein